MIKKYNFDYSCGDASVSFEVDTDVFNEEMAKEILGFFSWIYDKFNDPVEEVMKKYAIKVIHLATANYNNLTVDGLIREFNEFEGFAPVDGSCGIRLLSVDGYEFIENLLELEVVD